MNMATSGVRGAKMVCAAALLGLAGAGIFGLGGCASQRMSAADATAAPITGWDELPSASKAGNVTFGGQPSEEAIRRFGAEGGAKVIDLRTHEGRDTAGFDERATVVNEGMQYVHVPMSSSTFSAGDVDRFAAELRSAKGPVLVHCGSSNRAGGMWAAYLAREKGWDTEAAIEAGRAAGMSSESVESAARRVIEE